MAKRKKKPGQGTPSRSGKNRTPISGHKNLGGKLHPPFVTAMGGKMGLCSWMNDRLPEMLWSTLIIAACDRDHALSLFRRIINFIGKHERREDLFDLTHSGIAKLEPGLRKELIQFIVAPPEASLALAPLRLFGDLPAQEDWNGLLPSIEPDVELLMVAVGNTLWHQSQEATDCRWVRLMGQIAGGRIRFPSDYPLEELLRYPNEGDQRSVRPSIRSLEMMQNPLDPPDLTWAHAFWKTAWENTPCLALPDRKSEHTVKKATTREAISKVREDLEHHWQQSHSTTAIDPRHDGVFGMAFFGLRLLDEMLAIGIGTGILGRLGLRTLLELRVNMRHLLSKDDPGLWKTWREYGAGQAKLNALKFDDFVSPPKFINVDSIEQIAGEDVWEEFLSVNLAGWSGIDLRKMSESVGLKPLYDSHYSWTSGYSHGMWGPVREACFRTCGNPLHRLHRFPEDRALQDTIDDAVSLMDEILSDVAIAYPGFSWKLRPN